MNIRSVELYSLGIVTPALWPISAIIEQGYLDTPDDEHKIPNTMNSAYKMRARNAHRILYKFQSITCNVIASLAVLLTFGVAYPPLALLVSVYICATTSILHSAVCRHLRDCPKTIDGMEVLNIRTTNSSNFSASVPFHLQSLIRRIKYESNGLFHVLYKSMGLLLFFACGFISSFTVDQQEGYQCAIIVGICGISMLIIVFNGHLFAKAYSGLVQYMYPNRISMYESLLKGNSENNDLITNIFHDNNGEESNNEWMESDEL